MQRRQALATRIRNERTRVHLSDLRLPIRQNFWGKAAVLVEETGKLGVANEMKQFVMRKLVLYLIFHNGAGPRDSGEG